LIGCYSKDNFVHRNPPVYQEKAAGNISNENVNKFYLLLKRSMEKQKQSIGWRDTFRKRTGMSLPSKNLKRLFLLIASL